ncbi:cold-regulated protein 27 isoform X1 [Coffea arabica]|uniref:Cold-regulated protein 27 isoform X1 n=1 Tax=Coffea arabica TaxID=13443 RepID=A0A6P6VTX0_COFAR
MVESNRSETAPASANLVMEEFCSCELTRSNSEAASSLTVESSGDILFPSANARPDKCEAWTNEQHNKYLDYLEASFAQQLQRSRGFTAWCTEQNRSGKDSSKRLPVCVSKTSEQFSVLQDGQWQKIIFDMDQPLSYISTVKIPRIHCERCAGKDSSHVSSDPKDYIKLRYEEEHLEGKRPFSSGSASNSEQNHIKTCYSNSFIKDSAEGSGQNFADEDCEHDPHTVSLAKRLKTVADDTSSEDQIVPSGKLFALGKSIINNKTLGGQAINEDSSKDFENWSLLNLT